MCFWPCLQDGQIDRQIDCQLHGETSTLNEEYFLQDGYCNLLVGNIVLCSAKYRATIDKGWLDGNDVGDDLGCEVKYEVGCMRWAPFFNCLIQAS